MLQRGLCAGVLLSFVLVPIALASSPLQGREAPARPSLFDACRAWSEHMGDLIDQHRIAHEVDDDTILAALRGFSSAKDACNRGDPGAGLRIYETIPLGLVHSERLR